MKREIIVNGAAAWLEVIDDSFVYRRKEGPTTSGPFLLSQTEPGSYLVQLGTRTFRVSLGSIRGASGQIWVNGRTLTMEVFDPRDLRAGSQAQGHRGPLQIAASMPGKVVRVLVAPGEAVEAGQGLVVVEAMKMQNELRAPRAGRVMEVRTSADVTVASGDILIVIESKVE